MIELTVNDMTCGGCVGSITRVIKNLDPNAKVDANVETKQVKIDTVVEPAVMVKAIASAGYHPVAV